MYNIIYLIKSKSYTVTNNNSFLYKKPFLQINKNKRFYSTIHTSNLNNKQLGAYLAGLIEGDGSIYTPLINDIKN